MKPLDANSVCCSVSATPQGYAVFIQIKAWIHVEDVSVWCGWQNSIYAICVQWIFSKMALQWRRWDKLLIKVVIFIFFAYKKYSRRFIKFRLNHWWQMDYFDKVFHTFLCLDSVNYLAVNGTVTSLLVFIQNILNCVLKTNKAFTGLERQVINVNIFILGWSIPLTESGFRKAPFYPSLHTF